MGTSSSSLSSTEEKLHRFTAAAGFRSTSLMKSVPQNQKHGTIRSQIRNHPNFVSAFFTSDRRCIEIAESGNPRINHNWRELHNRRSSVDVVSVSSCVQFMKKQHENNYFCCNYGTVSGNRSDENSWQLQRPEIISWCHAPSKIVDCDQMMRGKSDGTLKPSSPPISKHQKQKVVQFIGCDRR